MELVYSARYRKPAPVHHSITVYRRNRHSGSSSFTSQTDHLHRGWYRRRHEAQTSCRASVIAPRDKKIKKQLLRR
ncbi:hypothetical protein OK016_08535 [Vibrio chagasii]|nr:hypothetical protein [Vibrio chagasii]